MNGIICIYKEKGPTSFGVVSAVRQIFGTKKVGHGGTLDPMAEGVLPVFIGNATKAVDFCPDDTKQYRAGFRFGIATDTQDITGNVIYACDQYVSRNKMIMIERKFKGEQQQVPPMYSAVKVGGQKLYDLARRGVEVERKPRTVNIYDIKIEHYEDNEGVMLVTCSKGTYIRTLIDDIGRDLGVGAVMTSLVRTKSGIFTIENAYHLGELMSKNMEELEQLLMPIEELYGTMPKAHFDDEQTRLFKNGAILDADRVLFDKIYDKGYYIEGSDGVFLGLGKINSQHQLEVFRRFNTTDSEKPQGEAPEEKAEKKEEISEEKQEITEEKQEISEEKQETAEEQQEITEESAEISEDTEQQEQLEQQEENSQQEG